VDARQSGKAAPADGQVLDGVVQKRRHGQRRKRGRQQRLSVKKSTTTTTTTAATAATATTATNVDAFLYPEQMRQKSEAKQTIAYRRVRLSAVAYV